MLHLRMWRPMCVWLLLFLLLMCSRWPRVRYLHRSDLRVTCCQLPGR